MITAMRPRSPSTTRIAMASPGQQFGQTRAAQGFHMHEDILGFAENNWQTQSL